ncbi:hypothetical protein UJ101_01107 [Flavobacteriaceae bacterium UJ101]|nr:hypothetical protein UJ101_01107 [Flavobacteriaceae bacterium UJ101]
MKTVIYLIFIGLISINLTGQLNDSLKLLGPKYTFFRHNVIMFNEYLDINEKGYNTTQIRYKTPIGKGHWNVRVDVPVVSDESSGKNGLGDLYASVAYIPYMTKKIGYWIRGRVFAPTASSSGLGYGKWLFSPTVGIGKTFSKNFTYLLSYEHRFSFAGQSDRSDYHRGIIDTSLIFSPKNFWFSFNPNLFFDYENNVRTSAFAAFEIGRQLSTGFDFYIRPSFGIGDYRPYNTGFEFGLVTTW